MFLSDIVKLLKVKTTILDNVFVKIVDGNKGSILYEGDVRDVENNLFCERYIVIEITRMNKWGNFSMTHLPIYNRPCKIVIL